MNRRSREDPMKINHQDQSSPSSYDATIQINISNHSNYPRWKNWLDSIMYRKQNYCEPARNNIVFFNDVNFIIPRQIRDLKQEKRAAFDRAKLKILRMDEFLVSNDRKIIKKSQKQSENCIGLKALTEMALYIPHRAFLEILSIDEVLPIIRMNTIEEKTPSDDLIRRDEEVYPVVNFYQSQDRNGFTEMLLQHRNSFLEKPSRKPAEFIYQKLCLIFELQRDIEESCLRILLHDIIFKDHLGNFRFHCEIHLRKPVENELVLQRQIINSHLEQNYSAEFVLWSGDWISEQEVELYVVLKIESMINQKHIGMKFWDMAHLHVKNVPHGASKTFLRELTLVSRPHKILSRAIHVGQVELEMSYLPDQQIVSVHLINVRHLKAERTFRAPETFIELVLQNPFNVIDTKRTKLAERSFNPIFDEELSFALPVKVSLSDLTLDLVFLGKSSLHHHPIVLSVLTLSKHTDWFPVRRFWTELERNPNVRMKDRFLFEGRLFE